MYKYLYVYIYVYYVYVTCGVAMLCSQMIVFRMMIII